MKLENLRKIRLEKYMRKAQNDIRKEHIIK